MSTDDDSSIESLHPSSIEGDDSSLESVHSLPNPHLGSPGSDLTSPYSHPLTGGMDYPDSNEDISISFNFDQMENTQFTNAVKIISVLLWNANDSKPELPSRKDCIACFKQCLEKFMARIPESASNGDGLAKANVSAWKQTEQLFDIFTKQLKAYVTKPTPDEYAKFPHQDHEDETFSPTVPKEVDAFTGQDVKTVPLETNHTDLQRPVADHEAEQKMEQKRVLLGPPTAGTKTSKGKFDMTIRPTDKSGRDILAMLNDGPVSEDVVEDDTAFAKQHLEATVINRQPKQKETEAATTPTDEGAVTFSNESQAPSSVSNVSNIGSSIDKTTSDFLSNSIDKTTSDVLSNSSDKTTSDVLSNSIDKTTSDVLSNSSDKTTSDVLSNSRDKIASDVLSNSQGDTSSNDKETTKKEAKVQKPLHLERDENHVKLDSMSTLLEEVKMMLSNVTRMPRPSPLVPSNNALYMRGMTGTDFLAMISEGQRDKAGDDSQFAQNQNISGRPVIDEVKVPETVREENVDEISVKLDFMHAEIEEVKMMLSNMFKIPAM